LVAQSLGVLILHKFEKRKIIKGFSPDPACRNIEYPIKSLKGASLRHRISDGVEAKAPQKAGEITKPTDRVEAKAPNYDQKNEVINIAKTYTISLLLELR